MNGNQMKGTTSKMASDYLQKPNIQVNEDAQNVDEQIGIHSSQPNQIEGRRNLIKDQESELGGVEGGFAQNSYQDHSGELVEVSQLWHANESNNSNLEAINEYGQQNENDSSRIYRQQEHQHGMSDQNRWDILGDANQMDRFEKVSEFLVRAENTYLSGIKNTLTVEQNRKFLLNERACLALLHRNGNMFNEESYACAIRMCETLVEASHTLIEAKRFYLAEKYLLRAKQIMEPSENHLGHMKPGGMPEGVAPPQIFAADQQYHEIRIEIALGFCEIYSKMDKSIKRKQLGLPAASRGIGGVGLGLAGNQGGGGGNEARAAAAMNSIQEEEVELETELEKLENSSSPPNRQNRKNLGSSSTTGITTNKQQKIGGTQDLMNTSEELEESKKRDENKMEMALRIINDIQESLTDDYFNSAKHDIKGMLGKFFSCKAEVLRELIKENKHQNNSEQLVEQMSIEMLRCAEFVISTLEGILLPLSGRETQEEKSKQVLLASILASTWSRLGKYYEQTRKDYDKAAQCFKNAIDRFESFLISFPSDQQYLREKFRRKQQKFFGRLAFEQQLQPDQSVVEFSEFEHDIPLTSNFNHIIHPSSGAQKKKNYLDLHTQYATMNSITMSATASPQAQLYLLPTYLSQISNHHSSNSLNKQRHLNKPPPQQHQPMSITSMNEIQEFNNPSQFQPQYQHRFKKQSGQVSMTFGVRTSMEKTTPSNSNVNSFHQSVQPNSLAQSIDPIQPNVQLVFPPNRAKVPHPRSAKPRLSSFTSQMNNSNSNIKSTGSASGQKQFILKNGNNNNNNSTSQIVPRQLPFNSMPVSPSNAFSGKSKSHAEFKLTQNSEQILSPREDNTSIATSSVFPSSTRNRDDNNFTEPENNNNNNTGKKQKQLSGNFSRKAMNQRTMMDLKVSVNSASTSKTTSKQKSIQFPVSTKGQQLQLNQKELFQSQQMAPNHSQSEQQQKHQQSGAKILLRRTSGATTLNGSTTNLMAENIISFVNSHSNYLNSTKFSTLASLSQRTSKRPSSSHVYFPTTHFTPSHASQLPGISEGKQDNNEQNNNNNNNDNNSSNNNNNYPVVQQQLQVEAVQPFFASRKDIAGIGQFKGNSTQINSILGTMGNMREQLDSLNEIGSQSNMPSTKYSIQLNNHPLKQQSTKSISQLNVMINSRPQLEQSSSNLLMQQQQKKTPVTSIRQTSLSSQTNLKMPIGKESLFSQRKVVIEKNRQRQDSSGQLQLQGVHSQGAIGYPEGVVGIRDDLSQNQGTHTAITLNSKDYIKFNSNMHTQFPQYPQEHHQQEQEQPDEQSKPNYLFQNTSSQNKERMDSDAQSSRSHNHLQQQQNGSFSKTPLEGNYLDTNNYPLNSESSKMLKSQRQVVHDEKKSMLNTVLPQQQHQQQQQQSSQQQSQSILSLQQQHSPQQQPSTQQQQPLSQQQNSSREIFRKGQLGASMTESIVKKQPTLNFEGFQIEIPNLLNNHFDEDNKKFPGAISATGAGLSSAFIQSKFDNFAQMQNQDFSRKGKINETESSEEEDEVNDRDENEDQQGFHIKDAVSYHGEESLKAIEAFDDQHLSSNGGANISERQSINQLRGAHSHKGSVPISVSSGGASVSQTLQTSPDIIRASHSQQQVQFPLKMFENVSEQKITLPHSFAAGGDNLIQQSSPNIQLDNHSSIMNNNNNNLIHLNSTASGHRKRKSSQSSQLLQNRNGPSLTSVQSVAFPSLKEGKFMFVKSQIKQLLFAPMSFYKSANSTFCQWNVNKISIDVISTGENQSSAASRKQSYGQSDQMDKGYDIRLEIFIESTRVGGKKGISNPLIFELKNQRLNFIEDLWPNAESKIETTYELAIVLLDRWIKERDFNVIEDFYNIELSYQNIHLQFILHSLVSNEITTIPMHSESIISTRADQIRKFGLKLNFILNKIAKITKKGQGTVLLLPYDIDQIDNAQLAIRQTSLQGLRSHLEERKRLRNWISYYRMEKIDQAYLREIQGYKKEKKLISAIKHQTRSQIFPASQTRLDQPSIQAISSKSNLSRSNSVEIVANIPQEMGEPRLNRGMSNQIELTTSNNNNNNNNNNLNFNRQSKQVNNNNNNFLEENQLEMANNQFTMENLQMQSSSFIQEKAFSSRKLLGTLSLIPMTNNANPNNRRSRQLQNNDLTPMNRSSKKNETISNLSLQGHAQSSPSSNSHLALLPLQQQPIKQQKYKNLKSKVNERVSVVKKESDPTVLIEKQVPTVLIESAPAFGGGTENGGRTNRNQSQIVRINDGFKDQIQLRVTSPRNSIPIQGGSEKQQSNSDQSKEEILSIQEQVEGYKKKYDLQSLNVPLNKSPLKSPSIPLALIAEQQLQPQNQAAYQYSRQNNIRIESIKRQGRDNYSSILDNTFSSPNSPQSVGYYSNNNSFMSSNPNNSSALSPVENIQGRLQRLPSGHSNKSAKSIFSKFAKDNNMNNKELNSSQSNLAEANAKKNSQFSHFIKKNEPFKNLSNSITKFDDFDSQTIDYFPPLAPSSEKKPNSNVNIERARQEHPPMIIVKEYQDRSNSDVSEKDGQSDYSSDSNTSTDKKNTNQKYRQHQEQKDSTTQLDIYNGDPYHILAGIIDYTSFSQNPFTSGEPLFSTVIKRNQLFFFIQVIYEYDETVEQTIFFEEARTHSMFILKSDSMVYKSGWKYEIPLSFDQFLNKLLLPYEEFTFYKFILQKGFNQKQKIAIEKSLEIYLKVEECKFILDFQENEECGADKSGRIYEELSGDSENQQNQQNLSNADQSNLNSDYEVPLHKNQMNRYQERKQVELIPTSCSHQPEIAQQSNDELNLQNQKHSSQLSNQINESSSFQISVPALPQRQQEERHLSEFKSNLDVKLLEQQGFSKLQMYETPARFSDFQKSFYLLNTRELSVFLQYTRPENPEEAPIHKLIIYQPMSPKGPIKRCIINKDILERCLNIKWLDVMIITLLNSSSSNQKLKTSPNQGLPSVDNLKKFIFSRILKEKQNMNGKKLQLEPIFSFERERIKNIKFTESVERLRIANEILLNGLRNNFMSDVKQSGEELSNFDMRMYIYYLKTALVSYEVSNNDPVNKNEIIFNNFEVRSVQTYSFTWKSDGTKEKILCILTAFRTKRHSNFEKLAYLRLDILPWQDQRNKQFRLIFNFTDIAAFFDRSATIDNISDKSRLLSLISKISKCLVYSKSSTYKSYSIPFSKINSQQFDRHSFSLVNRFNLQPQKQSGLKEAGKGSFLDMVQRGDRVIFTGVKRVLNMYAIITIGYYAQLDYYYFQVYLPSTGRRFMNNFYASNISNLSQEFMESIVKDHILKGNLEDLQSSKNYATFTRRYAKLDPSKNIILPPIPLNSSSDYQDKNNINNSTLAQIRLTILQNLTEESLDSSQELRSISKINVNPTQKSKMFYTQLTQLNTSQLFGSSPSFIEIYIWEEIVRRMGIFEDPNGEVLVKFDNYSGVIREYLGKHILNFGAKKNGLVEILIRFKDDKKNQDLFGTPSVAMMDMNSLKLDIFLRINFFEKINSVNEKVFLPKVFYQYFEQNKHRFRLIPSQRNHHLLLKNRRIETISAEYKQRSSISTFNNHGIPQISQNQEQTIENQEPCMPFKDCSFIHSDLIAVSHLLIDKIRASISEQLGETPTVNSSSVAPLKSQIKNPINSINEQKVQQQRQEALPKQLHDAKHGRKGNANVSELEHLEKKIRKRIKMNNSMNINELLDDGNKKLYIKTLFRGTFTVKPLQIIAVFFFKKFFVQIYNTVNGKNTVIDLTFDTVEHQIPFLKQMMKLELYQEVGQRLFFAFKNRIMLKSYPQLVEA